MRCGLALMLCLSMVQLLVCAQNDERTAYGDLGGESWSLCDEMGHEHAESPSPPILGIGITSKSDHVQLRSNSRNTWFKYSSMTGDHPKVLARFFISTPEDPDALAALHAENEQYGDIVIVGVPEKYANLPWQTLAMARYFSAGPVAYIMKSDDDTYVRPDMVVEYIRGLQRDPEKPLYCGWLTENAPPIRQGRWAVSKEIYPEDVYPIWAGGPAYMFSASLARAILADDKVEPLRIIPLEDISMALWVDRLRSKGVDIEIKSERRFYRMRICDNRAFNVLLEEGRPLEVNVTETFYALYDNDMAGRHFCAKGTMMVDTSAKGKTRKIANEERLLDDAKQTLTRLESNRARYGDTYEKAHADAVAKVKQLEESVETAKREAEDAVRARDEYWAIHAPAPPPPPKKPRTSVRLVYHDLTEIKGYHYPFLRPEGKLAGCNVTCRISYDRSKIKSSDAVVFAADSEFYSYKAPDLPTLPAGVSSYAILREALPKFPEKNWAKYDHRITYRREHAVTFGYVPDVHSMIANARSSLDVDRTPGEGEGYAAFVSRQCGNEQGDYRSGDGRSWRTGFVKELMEHMTVDSYGRCINNREWPEGHDRSKNEVMRRHKFCIAIENTMDPDYHTEKLWDCFNAGSVPVYKGDATVHDWVPPHSIININDFASAADLAAFLTELAGDDERYESYREWIHEPPQEWVDMLAANGMDGAPCRLCQHVAAERAARAESE